MKIINVAQKLYRNIAFAMYCFPKGNDRRFVHEVQEIGKHPAMVELEDIVGKSQENIVVKPIYHIMMEKSESGFFADFNRLLMYLYFAEKRFLIPVIEYSKDFSYAEEHMVNGTLNPFEYYFDQPEGISVSELGNYVPILRSKKENIGIALALNDKVNGYERNEKYIIAMGKIVKKYIHLNHIADGKIENDVKKLLGSSMDDVIGVHVRGTDFKQHYNGHPVMVGINDYIAETVKMMSSGKYQRIFLATDDSEAVVRFKNRFGEGRVFCYQDVIRSSGTDTVMHSRAERENHRYLLGMEVLRDMITLSKCGGFIAGLSQVSIAARIFRQSYGYSYTDEKVLDRGIQYKNGKNIG